MFLRTWKIRKACKVRSFFLFTRSTKFPPFFQTGSLARRQYSRMLITVFRSEISVVNACKLRAVLRNIPFSYSLYRAGAIFQMKLMRGVVSNQNDVNLFLMICFHMTLIECFCREIIGGNLLLKHASFENIKFLRGNYQTDSSETLTLYCLYCSPLNFLPPPSSKIILNNF